jgi:hypothetical protein
VASSGIGFHDSRRSTRAPSATGGCGGGRRVVLPEMTAPVEGPESVEPAGPRADRYSLILANPSFAGALDYESTARFIIVG